MLPKEIPLMFGIFEFPTAGSIINFWGVEMCGTPYKWYLTNVTLKFG